MSIPLHAVLPPCPLCADMRRQLEEANERLRAPVVIRNAPPMPTDLLPGSIYSVSVEPVAVVDAANEALVLSAIRLALEEAAEITGRCPDMGDIHADAVRAIDPAALLERLAGKEGV